MAWLAVGVMKPLPQTPVNQPPADQGHADDAPANHPDVSDRDEPIAGAGKGALTYVAALDGYLIRLGTAGGTVYHVNAATFETTAFPTTGGTAVPSTENGPYNKFLYVPRLKGCVYVPSHSTDTWFLRVH